jgi:HTH-type transcriptional regulator, sugar sensing transcriptional regulator
MDVISKLKQIGLSNREAEVYLALLQKSEFTAPELTKITKVTRTKIYEILQNLIHKGVCNENNRNGQKVYKAIKPKLAIQNVISNYENEIERKKKNDMEQMKQAGISIEKELVALHENGIDKDESLDYIEVLTDIGQIKDKWLTIQENTKKEILGFTKPPYTDILTNNVKREEDVIKSDVIAKGVYEYKDLAPEEINNLIKTIELFKEIGEEVRILYELPMKLCISDKTITMLSLNDRISLEPAVTTIVIDHPSFAKALKVVFDSYWQKGITLEDFKRNKQKYLNSI